VPRIPAPSCLNVQPSILLFRVLQLEKFKKADFGRCPRVLCHGQPLLPVGLTDTPYEKSVKLYCGRCEDIYSPKSTRHGSVDGAFFGTSFPHMMYLVYPALLPSKVFFPPFLVVALLTHAPPRQDQPTIISRQHRARILETDDVNNRRRSVQFNRSLVPKGLMLM
jgi:hypothetical protein